MREKLEFIKMIIYALLFDFKVNSRLCSIIG